VGKVDKVAEVMERSEKCCAQCRSGQHEILEVGHCCCQVYKRMASGRWYKPGELKSCKEAKNG
jgi:hypothetical protein